MGDVGVCLRGEVGIWRGGPAGGLGVCFGAQVGTVERCAGDGREGVESEGWVLQGEILGCEGGEAADARVGAEDLGEVPAERGWEGARVDVPEGALEVHQSDSLRAVGWFCGEPGIEVVAVGLPRVVGTGVHAAGLREVVPWEGINHVLIVIWLVDGHLRARLRHGVEEPGFIEEEVKRRAIGPDVADVGLAAAGHAGQHDRGSGFDGKEDEIEDVAAHVADTAIRIRKVENEIGAPFRCVAIRSDGGRVEGLDEMHAQPVGDEVI